MTEARRIPVSAPDLSGREREYVLDCLDSTWISSKGRYIEQFEAAFAEFVGARHAVACNNGTTALHLALLALGIGPGDEVLVPTLTYVASANAVRYCGATPVFVDSQPDTWNIDPGDAAARITEKTRAIMAVHLFGAPADLRALRGLADEHGLALVEDAAEAHGATLDERPVGALEDIGTFSFYGNKIITTGEGGMVVTNDERLARKALLLRGQGQSFERTYWFEVVGFNYRMTNVAAAIGVAQLENVDAKLERRRQIAERYRYRLRDVPGLAFQAVMSGSTSVHWLVCVTLPVESADERDAVAAALAADGIETRPFFYPLHTLPPYAGGAPALPVATRLAQRGLCLPTFTGLSDDDVDYVCDSLRASLPAVGELREIGAEDRAALSHLFDELAGLPEVTQHFHPHAWDSATADRIAARTGRDVYLGWFEQGRMVGYAMLRGWDEGYERPSFGVAVLPEHSGRGIGSRLLRRCVEIARERGVATVMLKVHKDNERALSWYRSVGFDVIGEAEDDQWLCELELVSAPAPS